MNINNKKITTLYEHYKNTKKKLKIICDWDEVIQPHEPYALWKTAGEEESGVGFIDFSKIFWRGKKTCGIEYTPFGSKLSDKYKEFLKEGTTDNEWDVLWDRIYILGFQKPDFLRDLEKTKNSPHFYQQAPFLTIAEDLLKLIKEDKVEKLIFLSTGDERKYEVFGDTFHKLDETFKRNDEWQFDGVRVSLRLLSEKQPVDKPASTKIDWIKYNAKDFDVFIDDDPLNCKSVIESNDNFLVEPCKDCMKKYMGECHGETTYSCGNCWKMNMTVIAPYYPAIENQHHKEVLLVKNEVVSSKINWKQK